MYNLIVQNKLNEGVSFLYNNNIIKIVNNQVEINNNININVIFTKEEHKKTTNNKENKVKKDIIPKEEQFYNINYNSLNDEEVDKLYCAEEIEYKLNNAKKLNKKEKRNFNFLEYKLKSNHLEKIFIGLKDYSHAEQIHHCSTYLEFLFNQTKNNLKLKKINSCKYRLCFVCNWRKSLKIYSFMRQAYSEIEKNDKKARFLFLTLTNKNCSLEDLPSTVDEILKAFIKLRKRKELQFLKGLVRSLEITIDREMYITRKMYNKKKDYYLKNNLDVGDFNPNYMMCNVHIHSILHTNHNDYTRYGGNWLSQEKITELWQKCLGVDYKPIVDIRSFKHKKNAEKGHEFAEMSKYTVKTSDILKSINNMSEFENDKKVVYWLNAALKNRRLFDMSGSFREIKQKIKFSEKKFEDYIEFDEDDVIYLLNYYFNFKKENYNLDLKSILNK